MRGKRSLSHADTGIPGLIPAHAGKTPLHRHRDIQLGAHPRACGENHGTTDNPEQGGGSSPRMRGKRSSRRWSMSRMGLIPAHAGKTPRVHRDRYGPRAHPRACGENVPRVSKPVISPGSSPRMRGKLAWSLVLTRLPGLIPAHAGKTGMVARIDALTRAHPRACGENCSNG